MTSHNFKSMMPSIMGHYYLRINMYMRENGRISKEMGEVCNNGKMVLSTRGTGKTTVGMAMEDSYTQTEMFTSASGRMIVQMAKVKLYYIQGSISQQMGPLMKETGLMINNMAKGRKSGQIKLFLKDSTKMAKSMGKVNSSGEMIAPTRGISGRTTYQEKADMNGKMGDVT